MSQTPPRIKFNRPQMQFVARFPRLRGARSIWGRGVGKSSIIYWIMQEVNRNMPRAAWALQGLSYQQILTRTLPGTLAFAKQAGLLQDRDFFLGRFPPKQYALPFQCPLKPDNCLFLVNHHTRTAVVFTLFSQDTSSRGPNRDGILVDESLLLDNEKFSQEAKATNRGNEQYYKHLPYHHGIFHFTSMPPMGSWLLSSADHYNTANPDLFRIIDQRIDLQVEFLREKSQNHAMQIYKEILELSTQIKFHPDSQGILHSEYNVFDNIENLGLRYVYDMFNDTPLDVFMIEVLNKRQHIIANSFYPQLNRAKHTYYGHFDYGYLNNLEFNFSKLQDQTSLQDLDCDTNAPLCMGMDFGTAINWIVVGQENKPLNQFTFLKDFYVKPPRTFIDCVKDFCNYYRHHKNKMVFIYPDGEGNVKRANLPDQPTYVDQVRKVLRQHGWDFSVEKTEKFNQDNHSTFLLWDSILSEQQTARFPKVKFNSIHCKDLLFSMERSPAINVGSRIKKDKASERKLISNREEATDAGDAADQIIFNRYKYLLKDRQSMGTPGSF